MNDIFDALNRIFAKGLKSACKNFGVLEGALEWLNEWEQKVVDGKIMSAYFLNQQRRVYVLRCHLQFSFQSTYSMFVN